MRFVFILCTACPLPCPCHTSPYGAGNSWLTGASPLMMICFAFEGRGACGRVAQGDARVGCRGVVFSLSVVSVISPPNRRPIAPCICHTMLWERFDVCERLRAWRLEGWKVGAKETRYLLGCLHLNIDVAVLPRSTCVQAPHLCTGVCWVGQHICPPLSFTLAARTSLSRCVSIIKHPTVFAGATSLYGCVCNGLMAVPC